MFDLIKVAERLKVTHDGKFVFLIAGDGPLKDALLTEVDAKGLKDNVVFLGWVKQASMKFLPQIDVFFSAITLGSDVYGVIRINGCWEKLL